MIRAHLCLALALLAACDAPDVTRDCDQSDGVITGHVTSGQTGEIVDADVTVRGTATQSNGHVIRRVSVAGISAKNDGFNFEQWSAVVPIGVLAGLPDAGGKVNVAVAAVDGCDQSYALDNFLLAVDRTPGVRVERLALAAAFPGAEQADEQFLPASGAASALITITANPDARGAAVELTASSGTFEGVTNGTVNLAGDGTRDATATVLFTPTKAETAVLSAHAKAVTSSPLAIRVAGPPTLVPAGAELAVDTSLTVTVFTDGKVASCQATPATGITVKSGDADLMARAAANDSNGDNRVDFTVHAVTAGASTTVACRDRYGQEASAVYAVAAP